MTINIFRKDFVQRLKEREEIEATERQKYRLQLDERADQEKQKVKHFYKDVERFQVIKATVKWKIAIHL